MKAVAEAVLDLPGLCPAAASLAALTRTDAQAAWKAVRTDPGAVLLLLRHAEPQPADRFVDSARCDTLLIAAQNLLQRPEYPFLDWRQPAVEPIWKWAVDVARLSETLAVRLGVPPAPAWTAGLLAPLGWLAIATLAPSRIPEFLEHLPPGGPLEQHQAWGLDHTTLVRRLARAWRLPPWLSAVVGNLSLHVDLAQRLGADPTLFRIVQLAILGIQRRRNPLHLAIASTTSDLLQDLRLTEEQFEELVATAVQTDPAVATFESPHQQPLLADLLRLALENRLRTDRGWIERLNQDLDRLHETLDVQFTQEQVRLQQQKLTALAEFAAGAGHEINNPLAVISGQAQYLLKQLQHAEEQLLEDPSPTLYLDTLKVKFTKSLQTIVGQSQRIHQVLIDLMHFARPQPLRTEVVPVSKLIADTAAGLRHLAEERRVRVICPEPVNLALCVDPAQTRTALSHLLKNAIEAAPAEGWASIRVERERDGGLLIVVEDNGPGLSAAAREHLFDPFFSGRNAGRGRGLGLPTAWRLARHHGGDVRHDGSSVGLTRFLLSLPPDLVETYEPATNGNPHRDLVSSGEWRVVS